MNYKFIQLIFFLLFLSTNLYTQNVRVIKSTNEFIEIEFAFTDEYSISDSVFEGKTMQFVSSVFL